MRTLLVVAAGLGLFAGSPGRVPAQARVPEYTRPIVLVVRPDSAEVERLRRRLGDEAFHITADDAMWYQAQAFEVLDSLRVPYAIVGRGPFRFRVGGVMREYTWADTDETWFALIYDGVSEPKVSFGVDLADEVRRLRPARSPRASPTQP
jgi:hypothetical protein